MDNIGLELRLDVHYSEPITRSLRIGVAKAAKLQPLALKRIYHSASWFIPFRIAYDFKSNKYLANAAIVSLAGIKNAFEGKIARAKFMEQQ